MDRKKEFAIAAAIGVVLLGIYYLRQGAVQKRGRSSNNEKMTALLAEAGKALSISERSKMDHCNVHDRLPDPACTPGTIFPNATVAVICVPGYTKTVRNVSAKTKQLIYAEYGLGYPQPTGSYEVDHLVPLELGGSNDIANLFPEAAAPPPGFHEKDLVENYLHGEVCAGRADLDAAQKQIANDWVAVYNALTQEELNALRNHAF